MRFPSRQADPHVLHPFFFKKTVDRLRTSAATHPFYLPIDCFHTYIFKTPAANLPYSERTCFVRENRPGAIFVEWNGLLRCLKLMKWPVFSGNPFLIKKYTLFREIWERVKQVLSGRYVWQKT